jgi:hypothetical protein
MKSPALRQYGRYGGWLLGSFLIDSVLLRPEMVRPAIGYLADIFAGEPLCALDGLTWVLLAIAGVGLVALRRSACFLVYTAYLYSLTPLRAEFPVFPVTPLLTTWIGVQNTIDRLTVHLMNGLFVLLVVSVHVALAQSSKIQSSRRAQRLRLVGSAAVLVLLALGGAGLWFAVRWQAIPKTVSPGILMAYATVLGVPLATWSIPSFAMACVRLKRGAAAREQMQEDGNANVPSGLEGTSVVRRPGQALQFTLRSLFIVVVVVSVLVAAAASMWRNAHDLGRYQQRFDAVAAWSDRIVVRCGGFNCCRPVDGQSVLFEVTDPQELADVRRHIELVAETPGSYCMCCGYPGVDWYRGKRRLALTSLHHGNALRWKGFPKDARLTNKSGAWVVAWLASHGVLADESKDMTRRDAERTLSQYVSPNLGEALAQIEADATSFAPSQDSRDEYVRAAFADKAAMYSALFRVLGCLTMRWDSWYEPEQDTAFEFLTHAPREELDQAIRRAAQSVDLIEKQGAARMVFSQFFMIECGKSESDIVMWMALLSGVAYADPTPENRRLVLQRLIDHRVTDLDLLDRAVSDPDPTVRRRAITALALEGSPAAAAILQRVTMGETQEWTPMLNVQDYTEGTGMTLNMAEMREQRYSMSDAQAASEALQAIVARQTDAGR